MTNDSQLLFKRLTIKGSTLRSRDAAYQQDLLEKFQELALPLLTQKKMKIEVHEVSLCPLTLLFDLLLLRCRFGADIR